MQVQKQLRQMKLHKIRNILVFFFLFSCLLSTATFALELPKGLQVAAAYNQQAASNFLINVSFLIAFLAGILTLLSPCVLPLVPAYFSIVFKEKNQIMKMTLFFFAGFSLMFLVLGMLATFLGTESIILLQQNNSFYIQIAGLVLIFFGILALAGVGFSGFLIRKKLSHDSFGVFLYGILFALGWTVCMGPILGGVLSMTAIFHNYFTGALLMFFYSFGMFVPLFIFSYFYDSHHLEKIKWMKGSIWHFSFQGKTNSVHTSNLISGILFIVLGALFFFTKGTGIINDMEYFGIKDLFYDFQRKLLEGGMWWNVFGGVIFLGIIYFVYKGLKIEREKVE